MLNRKHIFFWLVIAVLLSLALGACQEQAPNNQATDAGEPLSFTDDAGVTVTLEQRPQNVAVLFSSFADIWVTAGGQVAITVGESQTRGFASAEAILVDEGAGKTIDTEQLIAAQPDLVICSADIPAQCETAALLNSMGIACAQFRVESFADYLRVLQIFTRILDTPECYQQKGSAVAARIDAILAKIPQDVLPPQVLFIRSGSSASSAKAKTAAEHFAAAMLADLGAVNIAEQAPILLDGLSIEEILRQDPQWIFISTMGDEAAAKAYMEQVLQTPAWQALSAVQQGHYYYLPKDLFQFKPNARWDEAYLYLARILYPEISF